MKNYKFNLNLINPSALVPMCLIAFSLFITKASAQTEQNCPVPDYSLYNLQKLYSVIGINPLEQPDDYNTPPSTQPIYSEFNGCPEDPDNKRMITFMHGLAGNGSSWYKQLVYTQGNYPVAVYAANCEWEGIEKDIALVSQTLNIQLDNFANQTDQLTTSRCRGDDYVIAHSQGGIVARNLDWHWSHQAGSPSYGARKFYGLVTFGTPHAGAHIALTKNEHAKFVSEVVSSVILHDLNTEVYNLTSKLPSGFGSHVYDFRNNIDMLISNHLAPALLSPFHTNTLNQMRPGSKLMDTLTNYTGQLRRVAFFGVEDAPECWRVMDNVITQKAEDYPLWGANEDHTFMVRMEGIRAIHDIAITNNKQAIRRNKTIIRRVFARGNKKNEKLERENKHRQNALDFLNNANTTWRFLIGSYQKGDYVTVEKYEVTCTYPSTFPNVPPLVEVSYFSDINRANEKANQCWGTVKNVSYVTDQLKFHPSDGVVLVKSQIAFPNIKQRNIDIMPSNNHFQMRNSLETRRVLEDLYNGEYDQYFRLTE